jgi:uncharacterized protein (DUF1330 family)
MADEAKGYWIVTATISDPEAFATYTAAAGPVLGAAGARALAMPQQFEVVEGSSRGVPFIAEFPSYQAALDCYRSPEYQQAITLREGAAEFDVVIVQGVAPTG